jgi:hypothetical protein
MASWATRRKSYFGYGFVLVVLLLVGIPLFRIFYIAPTCFDGKQNQNETGVDCGGKCSRVCSSAFLSPRVQWAQADKIGNGIYNLGAYIVNPNLDGAATNVEYMFRLYDKNARLIGERKGSAYLPAHKNTLVFESGVQTGQSIPGPVTFEFTAPIGWEKTSFQNDGIIVSNKTFTSEGGATSLTATLKNTTLEDYASFYVYAVLYDSNGNQVGFSRTKTDGLTRNSSADIQFTWPTEKTGVLTTEVIPSINRIK